MLGSLLILHEPHWEVPDQGSIFPLYLTFLARAAGTSDGIRTPCTATALCFIPCGTRQLSVSAFILAVTSFSVLPFFFMSISLTGSVDHSKRRKTIFLIFSYLKVILTYLSGYLQSSQYQIAAVLIVLGMSCYSVLSVIYYSYLPIVSQADPSVLALKSNAEHSTSLHGLSALTDSIENVISRLSSIGSISGNMGSIATSVIVPSIIYVYAGP